jgi:uncharacterized protein YcfJ
MRVLFGSAALALVVTAVALSPTPAPAAGCVKGAVIGGIAGHYAGHHGVLGAGAGCLIGRHEANKHTRERADRDHSYDRGYHAGYGSSIAPTENGYAPR